MNTDPKLNVVPFVSVDHMMKLVLKVGIDRFLTELAATIEEDFRRWPVFDKTPRVASHSQEGVIELMPTSDGTLYGFKYVNGHPKNTRDGRQTVTAFGVLSDVGNGYPMLLTEMTILTALRTAATSAVAAKYLARPNAQWKAIAAGAETLVIFTGVERYVTPAWYATKRETGKVVPTWNYVTVQVRGAARTVEDPAWLRAQLESLTRQQEAPRSEPWAVTDAPEPFIMAQARGIVGVEVEIASIVGKFKLSQNRQEADKLGVLNGLSSEPESESQAMAALVKQYGFNGTA